MLEPTRTYGGDVVVNPRQCGRCDRPSEGEICSVCGERTYWVMPNALTSDMNLGREIDGRYRIDSLIAVGGMGAVYRGTRLMTGGPVAVKLIRSDLALKKEAVKRFHREARAMSRLYHPNTVRILDFGQDPSGDLFMVMELLQGQSLFGRLEHGPLTPADTARYGAQLARSLAEAHASDLIHRDLKPENVFLAEIPGSVPFAKVLDFGIARFPSESGTNSRLTAAGGVVGTPLYMAPEQALGSSELTAAVDVYSLGVLLYHCLVGRAPYDAPSPFGIMMAHVNAPVAVLTQEQAGSAALAALVTRMMAKVPVSRPTSHEVALALESFATPTTDATGQQPTAERRRRSMLPYAFGTIAVVLLATFLWMEQGATTRSGEAGSAGQRTEASPPSLPARPSNGDSASPASVERPEAKLNSPTEGIIEPSRTVESWEPVLPIERQIPAMAYRQPPRQLELLSSTVLSPRAPPKIARAARQATPRAVRQPSPNDAAAETRAADSGYERLEVPASPTTAKPAATGAVEYERLDRSVLP